MATLVPVSPTRAGYLILRNKIRHLWHGCYSSAPMFAARLPAPRGKGRALRNRSFDNVLIRAPWSLRGALRLHFTARRDGPKKIAHVLTCLVAASILLADDGGIDQQLRCVLPEAAFLDVLGLIKNEIAHSIRLPAITLRTSLANLPSAPAWRRLRPRRRLVRVRRPFRTHARADEAAARAHHARTAATAAAICSSTASRRGAITRPRSTR